jgi:hypothetical protein
MKKKSKVILALITGSILVGSVYAWIFTYYSTTVTLVTIPDIQINLQCYYGTGEPAIWDADGFLFLFENATYPKNRLDFNGTTTNCPDGMEIALYSLETGEVLLDTHGDPMNTTVIGNEFSFAAGFEGEVYYLAPFALEARIVATG